MTKQIPRLVLIALAIGLSSFLRIESSGGSSLQNSTGDRAPPTLAPQESNDDSSHDPCWWLGISCEETSKLLQRQLKIDGGLAIDNLVETAPAHRAGLKIDDVIVGMNHQPMTSIKQLNELVQKSQGTAIDFEILRDGQKTTLSVTPEKRPACNKTIAFVMTASVGEEPVGPELKKMLEQLKSQAHGTDVQVILVRPGIVLKGDSHKIDQVAGELDVKSPCELRFSFKEFEADTVLLSTADLEENKIVSGCFVKLSKVIDEQIAKRKVDLEQLKSPDNKVVGDDLKSQIKAHESQIKMLEETRTLLQNEIESQPESDEPNKPANDDQSNQRYLCQQLWS